MRESVIYQEIQQERVSILVLRQLTRRVGQLTPEMRSHLQQLPVAQLEELGEALLDFSSVEDLTDWLQGSSGGS